MKKPGRRVLKAVICGILLILFSAELRAQDQTPPADAGHISNTLHSQAYPEILYPHHIIPDWDRGYMIHHDIEVAYSPDEALVSMYDATGTRVREGRIWPKSAGSVRIRRAAASRDGAILAAGWAIMQDGSISGYIVKTDLAGNTVQTQLTGTFKPEQICEATDGTVWSLGKAGRPDGQPVPDTEVVRQYSFEKGLLHSFLPEITVQAALRSDRPWFNPFESLLRCGKEKISLYLRFTDEYAEIDTSSLELKRWKLEQSVAQGRMASGLAITEDGRVYISLRQDGRTGSPQVRGLYQIKAEPGNPIAQLLPVAGTINRLEEGKLSPAGSFVMLWGADRNQLVVWRIEDSEMPVSWVNILQADATN